MTMPLHYILVRHGESEGNVAVEASKRGDDSYYSENFVMTPGTQWRLTSVGVKQAQCARRGPGTPEPHQRQLRRLSNTISTPPPTTNHRIESR